MDREDILTYFCRHEFFYFFTCPDVRLIKKSKTITSPPTLSRAEKNTKNSSFCNSRKKKSARLVLSPIASHHLGEKNDHLKFQSVIPLPCFIPGQRVQKVLSQRSYIRDSSDQGTHCSFFIPNRMQKEKPTNVNPFAR